jgi:hypothetical protein
MLKFNQKLLFEISIKILNCLELLEIGLDVFVWIEGEVVGVGVDRGN